MNEEDLYLVADFMGLDMSSHTQYQVAKEIEYNMNAKIKELLDVTL